MDSIRAKDEAVLVDREGLQAIVAGLAGLGYRVLGPVLRDEAIIYDEISEIGDLPAGWTERQEAGRYRVERRDDDALFGFAVGPQSWKRFLHPPVERLWSVGRDGSTQKDGDGHPVAEKFAFIGVRACELHAIGIQDRVFVNGPFVDAAYAERRRNAFVVAVNCSEAGGTCFCVSMGTGPKADAGYDVALTELLGDGRHDFLVEIGSKAGAGLMRSIPSRRPEKRDFDAAEAVVRGTAGRMGRALETGGLKELLQGHQDHAIWEEVAQRCLTCGNCTMVCPTCFCTTVEDHSDLAGTSAERVRKWDSCFTMDFSYIHGGSVRKSGASRYRQWMTHKLAGWIDQFGTSGCVGCGRCISWCPVGIDITEEAARLAADVAGKAT